MVLVLSVVIPLGTIRSGRVKFRRCMTSRRVMSGYVSPLDYIQRRLIVPLNSISSNDNLPLNRIASLRCTAARLNLVLYDRVLPLDYTVFHIVTFCRSIAWHKIRFDTTALLHRITPNNMAPLNQISYNPI